MTKYMVKCAGKGVIFQTFDRKRAEHVRDRCIPEAQAKIITVPVTR